MKKIIYIVFLFVVQSLYSQSFEPYFMPNNGQWQEQIKFLVKTEHSDVWLNDNRLVFDQYLYNMPIEAIVDNPHLSLMKTGHTVSIVFAEINRNYSVSFRDSLPGTINFIKGQDTKKWVRNAQRYSSAYIQNFYKDIDLKLFFVDGALRYDFIVKPFADPTQIKYKFSGQDSLNVQNRTIQITTSISTIEHKNLYSYQKESNAKHSVKSTFSFDGHYVSFDIDEYDASKHMVIDPLIYSTFIGGSNHDYARDSFVDSLGHIYITGFTASENYPTSDGAYSEELSKSDISDVDAFVTKLSPDGKSLIFSTYFGSFFADYSENIEVNKQSEIFITGYFNSSKTFPTTKGVYDSVASGGFDVFITKLSKEGDKLLYSTVLGGKLDEYAQDLKIDEQGFTYVTGYTASKDDFPTTKNVFQNKIKGKYDIFVSKFSPDASILKLSTFVGGDNDDFAHSLFIDESQNIYVSGYSRSSNFPLAGFGLNSQLNDADIINPSGDVVVFRLNSQANVILFSSYLGGQSKDVSYDLFKNKDGHLIIAGYTESSDFPIVGDVFDKTYNAVASRGDCFISILDENDSLVKSTFFGGFYTDRCFALYEDKNSDIYITGSTTSNDLPVTANALINAYQDSSKQSDAFIAKFDKDLKILRYSTYLGGENIDISKSIASTDGETIIISGWTSSHLFPTTKNAYDTTQNNNRKADIFVSKLIPAYIEILNGNLIHLCSSAAVELKAKVIKLKDYTVKWTPALGLDNTTNLTVNANPTQTTEYTVFVYDKDLQVRDSAKVLIAFPTFPIKTILGPAKVKKNTIKDYSMQQISDVVYTWEVVNGLIISGQGTHKASIRWSAEKEGKIRVKFEDNTCTDSTGFFNVSISDKVPVVINPLTPTVVCKGQPVIFDAGSGFKKYQWSNFKYTRYDTVYSAGLYWAALEEFDGSIVFTDTVYVQLLPLPPKPIIKKLGNKLICLTQEKTFQWYRNGIAVLNENLKSYTPIKNGYYQVEVTGKNLCKNISDSLSFGSSVNSKPKKLFKVYPNPTKDFLFIEIEESYFQKISVSIYDYLGNRIINSKKIFSAQRSIKISTKQLNSGHYFLRLDMDKKIYIHSFVKL